MFNNSSVLSSVVGETAAGEFNSQVPCILWHLQNHSSYDQAQEACSVYTDIPEFGTGIIVVFWLAGLAIIICNAAVLWGIIRTPAELRKQLHILMANLAVVDLLAVCIETEEKCPFPTGNTGLPSAAPLLVVLNSAINPVASIIRTPDLRQSLRQDVTAIYRALVTMVRGNRVNPQDEQTP
ncbi:Gamma-tubulin complex component 5 [Branchiostoma belcheri]|nr:Gamma-tubulin complex component 5 [Branchiostoma belcheri]